MIEKSLAEDGEDLRRSRDFQKENGYPGVFSSSPKPISSIFPSYKYSSQLLKFVTEKNPGIKTCKIGFLVLSSFLA